MYASNMENNMNNLQNLMKEFSDSLTSVQKGIKSFDDIKQNVENIKNSLTLIKTDINTLKPPSNLLTLHNTVMEGCDLYLQGVNEFMKFYDDGDDEHFVTGGLKIQEGTELMYKAADMF
ncbi:MAG: hypothetical protein Kow0019_13320 [Methanobacteriaceae archaeon]